jgi:hypothetical protein
MSKRAIGLILNLVVSVAIGVIAGRQFFSIFDKTVPQGAMTDLVRTTTHGTYLVIGAVFGGVIFLWTVAAAWLSRFFAAPAGTRAEAPSQPFK